MVSKITMTACLGDAEGWTKYGDELGMESGGDRGMPRRMMTRVGFSP